MTTQTDHGVVREPAPCACGKPRETLMAPADAVVYTNKQGESKPVGTLTVTICLACDGGIEWVKP